MLSTSPEWATGSRVTHPELGTGVFIGLEPSGYARVLGAPWKGIRPRT